MYNKFDYFLLRTPLLPIDSFRNEKLDNILKKKIVQEAIYLASPVLYRELQKLFKGEIKSLKEQNRIYISVYKYISRMATRCTPFGLFAGCTLGMINDNTNILLNQEVKRYSRLDMYYLCTLSYELSKVPEIRNNIRYYPNTSLYVCGKKYRYIEYQDYSLKRKHCISAIDRSSVLNSILKQAEKGVTISDLSKFLMKKGISDHESYDFLIELIDSQVIVNELYPSVTGDDYLDKIIKVLEQTYSEGNILFLLKEIKARLIRLESNESNDLYLYKEIIELVKKINVPYDERYLFQVDMMRKATKALLSQRVLDELKSTMCFLNKISQPFKNENLVRFRKRFYERYEDREVSLMEVLDPEYGIGYPADVESGDIAPLLDGLIFPSKVTHKRNYTASAFQSVLYSKIQIALRNGEKEILFTDVDVLSLGNSWDDLPSTIYCIFNIIDINQNNFLLKVNSLGGSSAANLLSRFAYTNEKMLQWVHAITDKEDSLNQNAVLAEIVHLPDTRVGNILSRPHLRNYEIVYLSGSDLPNEQIIYLSDLYLSVRMGRIRLRSKRLNKEVIPRLTNAHNYRNNPMPVYRFLCDMQMQDGRSGLYFNWGHLEEELNFFPRVRYQNSIISLAKWKIKAEEIKKLVLIANDDLLIIESRKWREERSIPQYTLFPEGDNELFVDWEEALGIRALFSIIKKKHVFYVTEFMYSGNHFMAKNEIGNSYLNECIVTFYRDHLKKA